VPHPFQVPWEKVGGRNLNSILLPTGTGPRSELIQDVARYKAHPDCERLVCLVYDPAGFIKSNRPEKGL